MLVGCSDEEGEVDPVEALAAVELAETQAGLMPGGLMPIALEDYAEEMTADEAAQKTAERAQSSFEPEGCVTATAEGPQVVYALDSCTVRRGLGAILESEHRHGPHRTVSGTFTLTFTPTRGGFHIDIVGEDITGRHASFDVAGAAELVIDGAGRLLGVSTEGTGVGPDGQTITRAGEHLRTWNTDTQCFTLDGRWTFQTPRGDRARTVTDYERCGEACPKAGGQITREGARLRHHHHGEKGEGRGHGKGHGRGGKRAEPPEEVTVTVELDGSSQAPWSSSDGQSGVMDLDCTPESE